MAPRERLPPPVYLDHAATTPVRREVRDAMLPFLGDEMFGNPSSAHQFGRTARVAIEDARRRIARALQAEGARVLFTSGGTEADNLAVIGTALRCRAEGGPFRVAVGPTEHKAVLDAAHWLEAQGAEVLVLPLGRDGLVSLDAVEEALERGVALLSVMWVNNEVGVVEEVDALAERAAAAEVPFHTDAVQAVGKVPCSMATAGMTMLTLSGHKIGAPKGCGALVLRDPAAVEPLLHGGGQQWGLRPGTENIAGAVGLATAVELAVTERTAFAAHTGTLRDDLERRLMAAIPDAVVHGAPLPRAPHIANLSIPGTEANAVLTQLDQAGIACSSGAACAAGTVAPSHVLTALGVSPGLARAAIRFSFAARNTPADVGRIVQALPGIVERARGLDSALRRR